MHMQKPSPILEHVWKLKEVEQAMHKLHYAIWLVMLASIESISLLDGNTDPRQVKKTKQVVF